MKRAYIIFSVVVALSAGGLGAMTLLPTSGAQAVAEAASQNALKTETFKIEKMTCATCPITVKKAMGKVSGVSSVDVDFQAKTAKLKVRRLFNQIPEALDDSIAGVGHVSRIVSAMKELSHPG